MLWYDKVVFYNDGNYTKLQRRKGIGPCKRDKQTEQTASEEEKKIKCKIEY